MATAKPTLEERFWSKVDPHGPVPTYAPHLGRCWIFTLVPTAQGYGQFGLGNKKIALAHRWAYEYLIGAIPPGLEIDHLCRVRRCVHPLHLEPVPQRVNALRGISPPAENAKRTHCQRGHPFDQANTYVVSTRPGKRLCKTCMYAAQHRRYWARKAQCQL